jgi:hypothetical protein
VCVCVCVCVFPASYLSCVTQCGQIIGAANRGDILALRALVHIETVVEEEGYPRRLVNQSLPNDGRCAIHFAVQHPECLQVCRKCLGRGNTNRRKTFRLIQSLWNISCANISLLHDVLVAPDPCTSRRESACRRGTSGWVDAAPLGGLVYCRAFAFNGGDARAPPGKVRSYLVLVCLVVCC